jgi:hypothetical protein
MSQELRPISSRHSDTALSQKGISSKCIGGGVARDRRVVPQPRALESNCQQSGRQNEY